MTLSLSLSQAILAVAIVAATSAVFVGLLPPNPPNKAKLKNDDAPSVSAATAPTAVTTHDLVRQLQLTRRYTTHVAMAPVGLLALQAARLAWLYPDRLPASVLSSGGIGGLNTDLITWSLSTAIPLALIAISVPLRLASYAALGRNFTFFLSAPDQLCTTGLYAYVQHPSYTALVVMVMSTLSLLARSDGVLAVMAGPAGTVGAAASSVLLPLGIVTLFGVTWVRVLEEEHFLRAQFGRAWEDWHARTARFIPGLF